MKQRDDWQRAEEKHARRDCPRCGQRIAVGQMIKFSQRGRPMHTRCPGPGLPPRARSEVMAAEARIDELYREAAARSR